MRRRTIAALGLFTATAIQITGPHPAFAADTTGPNSGPSTRLFADSRMVVGDRFSVEVVGQGPDVIVIPGLASPRDVFRPLAQRLRNRYRLHLIQLAGFAGEPARANASGPIIAPVVEALDAYIVQAGLKRPSVIGHSLGGVIAMELAADHPQAVSKVMVVDTLAFYGELMGGPETTAAGLKPIVEAMGARMLAASADDFARSSQRAADAMATAPQDRATITHWTEMSDRSTVVRAMQEDVTTDLRPTLAGFPVPLTVLYEASLAPLMKADYAPVRAKTLIAAKPGARHFIMCDDPATFDAAVDAFLRS